MTTTPTIYPITVERHGQRRWQRHAAFAFAAGEVVVPIVALEMSHLVLSLPIAFVQQGEKMVAVAVMGLEPGKSLLVAPNGQWLGGYVPAAFRSYPFLLVPTANGEMALCINEADGMVFQDDAQRAGEKFFTEDGKLADLLQANLAVLKQIEESRVGTELAASALQRHGLLKPWVINIQASGNVRRVEGLFQVDELALGALADEAFLDLRKSGALALAYGQLLSMQNLTRLGELMRAREANAAAAAAKVPVTAAGELDLSFMERGGTLRF